MSVTVARLVQTVLRHALHLPWNVSSVSVEHCRALWCRPYTLRPPVYIVHGLLIASAANKIWRTLIRSCRPAACNKLPEDMLTEVDTTKFRKQLKTHFFSRTYNVLRFQDLVLMFYLTAVMRLCSICNRRTSNPLMMMMMMMILPRETAMLARSWGS